MNNVDLEKLANLDFKSQLVFAYLTCERLYPNYVYFASNYHFGDASILRNALDYIYMNIFNNKFDSSKISSLTQQIDKATPETAEFDTILASSALDACTATSETLRFMVDRDFSKIRDISTMATDTVHMYIQVKEHLDYNIDKEFDNKIFSHPLMKREITIQQGIIGFLAKSSDLQEGDISTLIHLQDNNASNIALQL